MLFQRRNLAIDMLRGLTMLLMVFVNDLWTVEDVPHILEHFDTYEDGMGLSDIVFPMFLFAMGMSIPYAIENRYLKGFSGESTLGHILSRTLALLLMGAFIVNTEGGFDSTLGYSINFFRILMIIGFFLIWNTWPKGMRAKPWLQALGIAILVFLAFTFRTPSGDFFSAGWWGILGLIGWAYVFSAVTYLLCRGHIYRIAIVWAAIAILNMLTTGMRDGSAIIHGRNFIGDFAGILHLGNGSNTIMAVGGMLLSIMENKIADQKASRRIVYAAVAAIFLAVAGAVTNHWWIISKNIGTLPWCLYVSSLSVAVYTLLRISEAHGKTGWFRFISPSGTATLTVYMMPYLLYSIWGYLNIPHPEWLTGWVGLIKCALFSLLCTGITALIGRIGLKLKI